MSSGLIEGQARAPEGRDAGFFAGSVVVDLLTKETEGREVLTGVSFQGRFASYLCKFGRRWAPGSL